jgi:hypothetical protein
MNEHDLDLAYTALCRTMTHLGESRATEFLTRFALLALVRLEDAATAQAMIDAAADIEAAAASSPQVPPVFTAPGNSQ